MGLAGAARDPVGREGVRAGGGCCLTRAGCGAGSRSRWTMPIWSRASTRCSCASGAPPGAGEPTAWRQSSRRAPTASGRRSRPWPSTTAPRWTCARRGRPRRKGAVEKAIDYLTQSWWRTAAVGSPEAAQVSADRWCVEVADARVRRIDGAVCTVAEAAAGEPLLELPAAFPATLTLHRAVSANALVSVWGNRYSVPPELAGTAVEVTHRCGTDSIEIHSAGRVAAAHRLAPPGAHRTIRLSEHTQACRPRCSQRLTPLGPAGPKPTGPPAPKPQP